MITEASGKVKYHLSFPQKENHFVKVEIEIDKTGGAMMDIKMPVWTPGSYKVRDFSRNVQDFTAFDEKGKALVCSKINKNTWQVKGEKGKGKIKVMYTVYAFEPSVRTSYVDNVQAFLHGVSIFMYALGYENKPCEVTFELPETWKEITVALPKVNGAYVAENYDLLADSPFALGNQKVYPFVAAGVPHRIAMLGDGNYDLNTLIKDFTRIIEKETEMFGHHPCTEYVIFIQNVESGGGGLEHLNSQTSVITRWSYTNELKYKSFLGLFAHEYFHLWNVKRIRPIELGPFNYDSENYTQMLWVAEGITSYFDDLFLRRCEFYTKDAYLGILSNSINKLENQPGNKVQTLSESSFDAWIKLYNPDENSSNSSISYYLKGSLLALILDLEILHTTAGNKRLDDVMKYLYTEYYQKKNRGFTLDEFKNALKNISGRSVDTLLDQLLYTTEPYDYSKYLGYVGIVPENISSDKVSLGISVSEENGNTFVKYVNVNSKLGKAGLSANDELISINGYRVKNDLTEFQSRLKPGEKIVLLISRAGVMHTFVSECEKDSDYNYKLLEQKDASEDQKKLKEIWLR